MSSRSFVAEADSDSEISESGKSRFDFSGYFTPRATEVIRTSGLGATATTGTTTITYVTMTAAVVGAVAAGAVGVGVGWWLKSRKKR